MFKAIKRMWAKVRQDHQMLTFSPAKAFLEGIEAARLHHLNQPYKPNPYVYSHHSYEWDKGFAYALYGYKATSFDKAMPSNRR